MQPAVCYSILLHLHLRTCYDRLDLGSWLFFPSLVTGCASPNCFLSQATFQNVHIRAIPAKRGPTALRLPPFLSDFDANVLIRTSVMLSFLFNDAANCWDMSCFGGTLMNEYGTLVEKYRQGEAQVLGEKPTPVPLCPPQIPRGLP